MFLLCSSKGECNGPHGFTGCSGTGVADHVPGCDCGVGKGTWRRLKRRHFSRLPRAFEGVAIIARWWLAFPVRCAERHIRTHGQHRTRSAILAPARIALNAARDHGRSERTPLRAFARAFVLLAA